MSEENTQNSENAPVLEGGTYEIIKKRLNAQGNELQQRLNQLNDERKNIFGAIKNELLGTERVTTENNCVAQDFTPVGEQFIFAYNVSMGLRSEIKVEDVFSIFGYNDEGRLVQHPLDLLADEKFESDFHDLYKYYKKSHFMKFTRRGHSLYMVFRIGELVTEIKVFKWRIEENGSLTYLDDRSVHEYSFPPQHEFEWQRTTRDMHVTGEHAHISIEDRLFVECIGGDLTLKVEDNTSDGSGIYEEDVENKDQTLDDAEIWFACVGSLILLKMKPYQEKDFRYIIFNEKTQQALRCDAIADSCIKLPDDQGIIFSKGYYLQSGEFKTFDNELEDMLFESRIISPNGEDFLYCFYNRSEGVYSLLFYNLIEQTVTTPLICHGYSIFPDGRMINFKAGNDPQKHHAVQIWQTSFTAPDFQLPGGEHEDHYLYKLGNKDIVSCMAECYEVINLLSKDESYSGLYVDLVKKATDILDSYFWISHVDAYNPAEPLLELRESASAAIEEYEKVLRVRKNTRETSEDVRQRSEKLLKEIEYRKFVHIHEFVKDLSALRGLRGEIIGLRELRYRDDSLIDRLEEQVRERVQNLSDRCVEFLLQDSALDPYRQQASEHDAAVEKVEKAMDGKRLEEEINETSSQLEMLIDIVSNLKIEDATQTTRIIDTISTLFSTLNQIKAALRNRIRSLMSEEGAAEFNAQMKLLSQSLANYLDVCEDPETCEEYLTKVMVQLEELESRFSEFDDFILQLTEKREEITTAFEQKRLLLTEQRNKRSQTLMKAADRILKGIGNRVDKFKEIKEINSYFAADLMIEKIRDITDQLRAAEDPVKADDLTSRLKTLREDAVRQLKDKKELFVDGKNIIQFGPHKFSVNPQKLELTLIRRDEDMFYHLTGTRFFEKVEDKEFLETAPVWNMEVISEDPNIYRAEFLAQLILNEAQAGKFDLGLAELAKLDKTGLLPIVQKFMAPRYGESYMKGIHDNDACLLLEKLLPMQAELGMLRFGPSERALARIFWNQLSDENEKRELQARLRGMGLMRQMFSDRRESGELPAQLAQSLQEFLDESGLPLQADTQLAADYLVEQFSDSDYFLISRDAFDLTNNFRQKLQLQGYLGRFDEALAELNDSTSSRFDLITQWVTAFINGESTDDSDELQELIPEVSALIFCEVLEPLHVKDVTLSADITGLLGNHTVIGDGGSYRLHYPTFSNRLLDYNKTIVPAFELYQQRKKDLSDACRKEMRLEEFMPRVLSSFVRNKLINELYLPLIGDNLAKQMGVVGENKRTDLMGMLLLISPPGYGKTTLMEYVAFRLGLVFMKINGPAIGHQVTSLDPAEAPNASAREELKKLNLAFEMGDNVMIYLDDIQHCNPEMLQKFISLCDGQRKIEGVYKGQPKTYDLRGRKVCVCMAGNPYTESGDKFQIPDMLANRADTYNLGDIIGDTAAIFNLSYIENSLTSNASLNKLASRSQKDVHALIAAAEKGQRDGIELEGSYSAEELSEIIPTMEKMLIVRDMISKVNQEYIASAAQADEYRVEPPFKLQGSYRNMNKIAEKIHPIMNDEELKTLILSHYENESQTLTTGAEFNLLRFRELYEVLTEEQAQRLVDIRKTFGKNQLFQGSDGNDPMDRVIVQMGQFSDGLEGIGSSLQRGMEELAGSRNKQTETEIGPRTLDALHAILASKKEADAATNPKKTAGAIEVIPDRIEIVNAVPDFFATILQDQLKLMQNWLEPMLKQNSEMTTEMSQLRQQLTEMTTKQGKLLGKIEGSNETTVEKTLKGKKVK